MCIAAFLACRVYIPLSLEAYEAKKKELGVDKNLTTEVSAQYRNKYMFLWDPKYLLYIHHPYNQNQLIRSFLQMEFQSGFLLANNVVSRYETFPYIFPFHNPSFLLTFQTYFWNILKTYPDYFWIACQHLYFLCLSIRFKRYMGSCNRQHGRIW